MLLRCKRMTSGLWGSWYARPRVTAQLKATALGAVAAGQSADADLEAALCCF